MHEEVPSTSIKLKRLWKLLQTEYGAVDKVSHYYMDLKQYKQTSYSGSYGISMAARIGIIAIRSMQNYGDNFSLSPLGYGLSLSCGSKCNNGELFDYTRRRRKYEEEITMTLDMRDNGNGCGELSFKINDTDCGVAYWVCRDVRYCLAMTLFYSDNGFEILECK